MLFSHVIVGFILISRLKRGEISIHCSIFISISFRNIAADVVRRLLGMGSILIYMEIRVSTEDRGGEEERMTGM